MERVLEKLLEKPPALLNRKNVVSSRQRSTARCKKTVDKITQLDWEIMCHPPYSPDLSPADFHLILNLNNTLKNKMFKNETDLKTEVHNFFLSKNNDFYKNDITKLQNRWNKVIQCDEFYYDD